MCDGEDEGYNNDDWGMSHSAEEKEDGSGKED